MQVALRCPYCSTDVAADAQYCSSCGSRLVAASQLTAPARTEVEHVPALGYGAPPPYQSVASPSKPASKSGIPTWLKVALIVAGVFMLLAVAGGVLLYRWANTLGVEAQNSIPYPVFIGDCVAANELSGVVPDCDEAHQYEVFHVFAWPGTDTYPDWSQTLDAGWEACQRALDAYLGIDWIDSVYDYEVIAPPQDRWEEGERTMNCVLHDIFEDATIGSAMGARRGATGHVDSA